MPRPAMRPTAVVALVRQHLIVVDASASAQEAGARIGLSLAEARALCPHLETIDHDPLADKRALEALGRWMTRFTPSVATGWAHDADDPAGPPPPPLLMLDVTGCERLFGSIDRIARDVRTALARFGLPARVAVAPTVGAAWALARYGHPSGSSPNSTDLQCPLTSRRKPRIPPTPRPRSAASAAASTVSTSSEAASLYDEGGEDDHLRGLVSPLPVEALRLDAVATAALHRLGLDTIGHVLALPRQSLPARFGQLILTRLDQLLGRRPEPLVPLPYDPPVEAKMTFEGAITSLDTLALVLQELLRRVVIDLTRRGHGARQIELTCLPDPSSRKPAVTRVVDLSRASRDPARLFTLLRTASENLQCGRGFIAVHLVVTRHERTTAEQINLLEDQAHADATATDALIERLRVRLGPAAIVRPTPVESYIPERAWRPLDPDEPPARRPVARDATPTHHRPAPRPLHLLATPAEISVVSEPSNDFTGRPAQFTHAGRVHRLSHVSGPERIAGEWWRGHDKTRDYYDGIDQTGRRFWLFRVVKLLASGTVNKRWFLHGFFGWF